MSSNGKNRMRATPMTNVSEFKYRIIPDENKKLMVVVNDVSMLSTKSKKQASLITSKDNMLSQTFSFPNTNANVTPVRDAQTFNSRLQTTIKKEDLYSQLRMKRRSHCGYYNNQSNMQSSSHSIAKKNVIEQPVIKIDDRPIHQKIADNNWIETKNASRKLFSQSMLEMIHTGAHGKAPERIRGKSRKPSNSRHCETT